MGAFVAPAIMGGVGIFQALSGKHSASNAQKAQQQSQQQALQFQGRQQEIKNAEDYWAMQQAQQHNAQRQNLIYAALRGYGATGLQDAPIDYGTLNAPPPNLPQLWSGGGTATAYNAPSSGPTTLGSIAGRPSFTSPTPVPSPVATASGPDVNSMPSYGGYTAGLPPGSLGTLFAPSPLTYRG